MNLVLQTWPKCVPKIPKIMLANLMDGPSDSFLISEKWFHIKRTFLHSTGRGCIRGCSYNPCITMGFILSSTATGTLSPTAHSEKLLLLVKSLWQELH